MKIITTIIYYNDNNNIIIGQQSEMIFFFFKNPQFKLQNTPVDDAEIPALISAMRAGVSSGKINQQFINNRGIMIR